MKRYAVLLLKLSPLFVLIGIFVYSFFTYGVIEHPGKSLYNQQCASCHGKEGEGIKKLIPPLKNADIAIAKFDSMPCWIKNGMNGDIVVNGITYNQPMYPIKLNDVQTANVMNYIAEEFLQTELKINSAKVRELLKSCPTTE